MGYLFYVLILAILVYVIYRNINLYLSYRNNKGYISCYQDLLLNEDNTLQKIDDYIASQKSEESINKAKLLRLYALIDNDLDYRDTIDELDFKPIFFENGKASKSKLSFNNDIFVWLYLCLAKARNTSKFDVLETLNEKINDLHLDNRLEVKQAGAIYNALSENDTSGVDFLNDVLQGNYIDYDYDKQLIGLYKRFAAATLAYCAEPLDDYYKEDLRKFASTMIGQNYLKNLEIYDKYPPLNNETTSEE